MHHRRAFSFLCHFRKFRVGHGTRYRKINLFALHEEREGIVQISGNVWPCIRPLFIRNPIGCPTYRTSKSKRQYPTSGIRLVGYQIQFTALAGYLTNLISGRFLIERTSIQLVGSPPLFHYFQTKVNIVTNIIRINP